MNYEIRTYETRNKRWVARMHVGKCETYPSGYVQRRAATRDEAIKSVEHVRRQLVDGLAAAPAYRRIGDEVAEYTTYALDGTGRNSSPRSPSSCTDVRNQCAKILADPIAQVRVDQMASSKPVDEFLARMVESGLRKSTIKKRLAFLSNTIDHAARNGRWGARPNFAKIARVPRDAAPPRPRRVLSEHQLRTFVNSVVGDPLEACWLLMAFYGLRPGEVRALRWHDVDLRRGTVAIEVSGGIGEEGQPVLTDLKHRAHRALLYLDDGTASALQRAEQDRDFMESLGDAVHDGNLVFPTANGTLMDHNNFRKRFRTALRNSGAVPDASLYAPYDLRHTCATLIFDQYDGEYGYIMKVLRHQNLETVRKYLHHEAVSIAPTEVARLLD